MKIRKIIAPIDLSKLSRAALRYATEMASAVGAEVIVYNVISEEASGSTKTMN